MQSGNAVRQTVFEIWKILRVDNLIRNPLLRTKTKSDKKIFLPTAVWPGLLVQENCPPWWLHINWGAFKKKMFFSAVMKWRRGFYNACSWRRGMAGCKWSFSSNITVSPPSVTVCWLKISLSKTRLSPSSCHNNSPVRKIQKKRRRNKKESEKFMTTKTEGKFLSLSTSILIYKFSNFFCSFRKSVKPSSRANQFHIDKIVRSVDTIKRCYSYYILLPPLRPSNSSILSRHYISYQRPPKKEGGPFVPSFLLPFVLTSTQYFVHDRCLEYFADFFFAAEEMSQNLAAAISTTSRRKGTVKTFIFQTFFVSSKM